MPGNTKSSKQKAQELESIIPAKSANNMNFVCPSSAGHEKIALLMRNVSFFLTKTTMDEQLCELLKLALQNPEGSSERDRAIDALCIIVTQLKENQGKFNHYLQRYYPEALEKTKEYFNKDQTLSNYLNKCNLNLNNINCQSTDDAETIQQYLIIWIWDIFYKRSISQYRRTRDLLNNPVSTSKNIKKNSEDETEQTIGDILKDSGLTGLDKLLEDELQHIAIQLKNYIETDPKKQLRNCHVENQQQCNCQTLVQLRFLREPPLKLRELSKKLEIPLATISSHLDKKCKKLLREIAKELGYE